ncbi:general substrate transporter [Myriangium duriaei CBS 260.36]|uniref:General substrate transporter n=1 Tax=Myriangium duriaei CBS 260.36 TaxID=1168546 RepID=A0A9P4IYE5_9PEZI|nr:general substrate transporter [Myriangium duriaei CBS 260.36]
MKDEQIVGEALAKVLPAYGKPWWKIRHLRVLNLILLVPLLSSVVGGYDGSVFRVSSHSFVAKSFPASLVNGIQSTDAWKAKFGNPSGARLGFVTASQSMGSIAVLPFVPALADKVGRKPTILSGIIVVVIASAIMAASVNYAMLIISRVTVGIGGTLLTQPSPMLISELCYPTHRGKYTSLYWTTFYLGAFLAAWTTFGAQKHFPKSNWAWRIPSILQAGCPIVQLCFIWAIPESPHWLIENGRIDKARQILIRFHAGGSPAPAHDLIEFEIQEIIRSLEIQHKTRSTDWSTLVATPGNRRRTLITVCLGCTAMWNGITVCNSYLTLVLDSVGVTSADIQTLINGLLQLFNLLVAVGGAFMVDRLGRRTLFLWSGVGMLLCFVSLTACAGVFNRAPDANHSAAIAVIVFIFLYFFHYDIAYTPLLFGYTTEILPYTIRAKGLTVQMFVFYSSLIILSFVNPIGLKNIGWHYYIVSDGLILLTVIISYLLFIETRGYTVENLAQIFDGTSDGSCGKTPVRVAEKTSGRQSDQATDAESI